MLPASILSGTIVGAGIFSLPFVFQEAGLLTSLFYLLVFSLLFIGIYVLYADVIVRTPGDHRFVGYAKMYLGEAGFFAAFFLGLVQLFFVLTIYLILAPSFSKLFVPDGYVLHLLVFWALASAAVLFNTKRIAFLEFLIVGGIVAIITLIFGEGVRQFFSLNVSFGALDIAKFSSVGPILFALSGSLAIPEVISYFQESHTPISSLKKSLIAGALLPAALYWIFVIGVIGLSPAISEDAVSGLAGAVPAWLLVLLGVLGFLSLISSYIVAGLNARRILEYDLALPEWLSRSLVVGVPLILYFLGFQNFIQAVSFVGEIFLPIESIFIVLIWLNANRKLGMPPVIAGRVARMSVPLMLLVFMMILIYAII